MWESLKRRPFSRLLLIVTVWMTWRVTEWAFGFATTLSARPGLDVAATIAAVTAPFTALQGWAFKVYTEGKSDVA